MPLARKGFRVTARDISPDAIARLRSETARRSLVIPKYDATMVIEEKRADDWREVVRTTMTYYAVSIEESNWVGCTPAFWNVD